MPQTESMPPNIGRLNLGIILETPFLFQALMLPKIFNTVVQSTALPSVISNGSSTYTYKGSDLALNVFVNETSEKRTEYHYTPYDPTEKIEAISAEIQKLKVERKTLTDKVDRALYKTKIKLYQEDIKKLKKMRKQGIVPAKLARTSFHEKRLDADIDVAGETIFEYDGPHIVKGTSTSTTTEDPPQVTEMIRLYNYNFLGQLISMDLYGSLTEYSYDPLCRLASAECKFVAPTGDFVSSDKTTYTYAPPGSDPIPANSLIASLTEAYSGPEGEMEKKTLDLPQPPGTPAMDAGAQGGDSQGGGPGDKAGGKLAVDTELPKEPSASGLVTETWDTVSDASVAGAETLSGKGAAVGQLSGSAKATAETGSQAATALSSDPCEALAALEFNFEMPKLTETTVTGVYVYAG